MGPIKKQRTRNLVLSQIFLCSWGAENAPVFKARTFVGTLWYFQNRIMLFHLILKFLPWSFEKVGEQFSNPSALQEVSPTLYFLRKWGHESSQPLSEAQTMGCAAQVYGRTRHSPEYSKGWELLSNLGFFVDVGCLIWIFTELVLTLFPHPFLCSLCPNVSIRSGRGPIA